MFPGIVEVTGLESLLSGAIGLQRSALFSDGGVNADEIVVQRFLFVAGKRLQLGGFEQDGFALLVVPRLELRHTLLQ